MRVDDVVTVDEGVQLSARKVRNVIHRAVRYAMTQNTKAAERVLPSAHLQKY